MNICLLRGKKKGGGVGVSMSLIRCVNYLLGDPCSFLCNMESSHMFQLVIQFLMNENTS